MKLPSCNQCEKDGIACSGYGSNKPVTFLPTGMRSRQKKRRLEDQGLVSVSSNVSQAFLPKDLLRKQDVYFVNAANFRTLVESWNRKKDVTLT